MSINIVPNQKIPTHPDVLRLRLRNAFYDASFEGGPEYKNARDAQGMEVFIPHEQESDTNIVRRKRLATYRNYCRPIIEKYNSTIFTTPIQRDQSNLEFENWSKNVDMNFTTLHDFMRNSMMQSQKFGNYYIIVDSTKGPESLTVAQSRAAGNRLYLIPTHPDTIVNWQEVNGILTDIIISFKNREYIYYTQDYTQRFTCNEDNYVVNLEEPIDNVTGMLPVVKLCARTDDLSQIRDISELNKIIFNLDSLLIEELYRNTFSQVFISGISPDDLDNVNVSGRKVITIKKPDAQIHPVSADASQAASIRESIHIYEKEVYRAAGLQVPDVVQNTESGRALKLRMNDSQQIAADIADNAEKAENYIIDYWSKSMSMNIAHCDYPEDFQTEDLEIELKMTLDMIGSTLPKLMKNKQTMTLAKQLFPKLSASEMDEIRAELDNQV